MRGLVAKQRLQVSTVRQQGACRSWHHVCTRGRGYCSTGCNSRVKLVLHWGCCEALHEGAGGQIGLTSGCLWVSCSQSGLLVLHMPISSWYPGDDLFEGAGS